MDFPALLRNLGHNLIGRCRNQRLLFALFVFYATYIKYRKRSAKPKHNKYHKKDNKPLITFSGGGQLGFYFIGVSAYLLDNFDLSNARFAGVSIGCGMAGELALELPIEKMMAVRLKWFKIMSDRMFKLYFMNTSHFVKTGHIACDYAGITDEWICAKIKKRELYFGATDVSSWPPKHVLLKGWKDINEHFTALSCSCRTFPFFREFPAYYNKMWLLDGGFSTIFSGTNITDNDNIIRISPSSRVGADICPDPYSENYFTIMDAIRHPSLDDICQQFENGYNDALRCRYKLIAKGLRLKSSASNRGTINTLESHMKVFRRLGEKIFSE